MTTLTTNQQHLINQIITEFIQHNQSTEFIQRNSLLGIHEIIDEIDRKKKEIARVLAHNESVQKAMEPVMDDHYEALAHEINALGLHISRDTIYSHNDGTRCNRINIKMEEHLHWDLDMTIEVQVRGDAVNFEGKGCLPNQLCQLRPKLIYRWNSYYGWMSFEQMCEHEYFRKDIKKLYEQKQNRKN